MFFFFLTYTNTCISCAKYSFNVHLDEFSNYVLINICNAGVGNFAITHILLVKSLWPMGRAVLRNDVDKCTEA